MNTLQKQYLSSQPRCFEACRGFGRHRRLGHKFNYTTMECFADGVVGWLLLRFLCLDMRWPSTSVHLNYIFAYFKVRTSHHFIDFVAFISQLKFGLYGLSIPLRFRFMRSKKVPDHPFNESLAKHLFFPRHPRLLLPTPDYTWISSISIVPF